MAGGSGARFWPLSRNNNPKQLLNIIGEKSMLQITINRLLKLKNIEGIYIITRSDLAPKIKQHVNGVPDDNIIIEPEGKNTAPCIALAALRIEKINKNGHLALLDKKIKGIKGGGGEKFNWEIAKILTKNHEFILAGGLTPKNIKSAITSVKPWGVDVSSGVETNNIKDNNKILDFSKIVHSTKNL